jgi:hypothetical protein
VIYAAIVRRDIVGVEEDAFLHCGVLASQLAQAWNSGAHTSLEAGNWGRHLDAAGEKVWESRKDSGEKQPDGSSSRKYEELLLCGRRHFVQCY